ncbi:MAG: MlaD family protein [Pseudomonadota bacterium]
MKKVLGTIVLLSVVAVCVFGGWQFYQKRSSITVVFNEAKGLQPGALVQMSGIDIGKVRNLALSGEGIDVSICLDQSAKKRLSSNSLFVIDSNPRGGKPALVLVKDGAPGGMPLVAQTRIQGVNSTMLWQLSDFSNKIEQMMDSKPVRDFVKNLNGHEKEMDEAIRNFDSDAMKKRLEEKILQLSEEFEQVLHEADAKQKLEQISSTITRLSAAISRIRDSDEAKKLGLALDDLGRRVQAELTARK